MIVIQHRVNSAIEAKIKKNKFFEIDLRDYNNQIILHHDPFSKGENFEHFLKKIKIKFLILNIKSEGIEEEVLRLVKKYNVADYFFLDTSIPFMVKYINKGWTKFAVRFRNMNH